jgi:hypothetical protein
MTGGVLEISVLFNNSCFNVSQRQHVWQVCSFLKCGNCVHFVQLLCLSNMNDVIYWKWTKEYGNNFKISSRESEPRHEKFWLTGTLLSVICVVLSATPSTSHKLLVVHRKIMLSPPLPPNLRSSYIPENPMQVEFCASQNWEYISSHNLSLSLTHTHTHTRTHARTVVSSWNSNAGCSCWIICFKVGNYSLICRLEDCSSVQGKKHEFYIFVRRLCNYAGWQLVLSKIRRIWIGTHFPVGIFLHCEWNSWTSLLKGLLWSKLWVLISNKLKG